MKTWLQSWDFEDMLRLTFYCLARVQNRIEKAHSNIVRHQELWYQSREEQLAI
jgi:hypothetical protein